MIKKWWPFAVGFIVIAGILTFALQQILVKTTLSEQEVITRVESLYNGKVEEVTKEDAHYNVIFADGSNVYEVQVDEEQGTFQDLNLILIRNDGAEVAVDNNAANQKSDANSSTAPNSEAGTSSTSATRITAQDAQSLALQQMTGELEEIEYFQSADGGYYIIEIDDGEIEASFQIHAITGKILSVVYDD